MASERPSDRPGAPSPHGAPWSEFEQLYRDHRDHLTTYVTRRGLSSADASDIVSTSFANLWRLWQQQKRPREPAPYLYQVVKSRMIDHLRREKREADHGIVYASQEVIDAASPVEEFTDSFHAVGLRDAETSAARSLPHERASQLSAVPVEESGRPKFAERDDTLPRTSSSEYGSELPLEFEAYYLSHQESFHDYAQIHFSSRETAEEIVHAAFLEIHKNWPKLLTSKNLEQGAWEIIRRVVREHAELIGATTSPISQALAETRNALRTLESSSGLYEAIAELPNRQFDVIVLRHVLGYPTSKIAWYLGIDERTVGHHLRRGKARLRDKLGLRDEH